MWYGRSWGKGTSQKWHCILRPQDREVQLVGGIDESPIFLREKKEESSR
jgi:hypothetical protein